MYAEERQQAIAALVLSAGRVSVTELAESTTSPPRPCAATSPSWSGPGWSAGCTAALFPCGALTLVESGVGERDTTRTEQKDADRRGRGPTASRHRRQRAARRRHHHRPARRPAPRRP